MSEPDDFTDIPPLVPDRDDLDTHKKDKIAQSQDIVRPSQYTQLGRSSSWPMRLAVWLLFMAAMAGSYGAYYFYGLYQDNLRQTNLRISDLELRLALVDESAAESDNTLMENIEQTIEQYDLLWANWRANNRAFEDFKSEIARLKLANEGQDEMANNLAQSLADTNKTMQNVQASLNTLDQDIVRLDESVIAIDYQVGGLASLRNDLESIREALDSGGSTVLGLVGRLEYMEESMESVNVHRQQVNEALLRMQENVQALQVQLTNGSGNL